MTKLSNLCEKADEGVVVMMRRRGWRFREHVRSSDKLKIRLCGDPPHFFGAAIPSPPLDTIFAQNSWLLLVGVVTHSLR